jgi:hypothetical protein
MTSDPEAIPMEDQPSASLRRRWARRLSKGNVPVFTVFTTKGCHVRIQRGQMRIMQIGINEV